MCVRVYMYIYIYAYYAHVRPTRTMRVRTCILNDLVYPNVANIREKDKARRLDEIKREGDTEGERKGRDLLLIANYPARQLHIII